FQAQELQPLLPPESARTRSLGAWPWRRDPSRFHQVAMEWAAKAGVSCEMPTQTVPRLLGGSKCFRRCPPAGVGEEVMIVHWNRRAIPFGAGVLEVADQFAFLTV